jgi:hypothetical protein
MLPSLAGLIPSVGKDLLHDITDGLSSSILSWVPSKWITDDFVRATCELHEEALRKGRSEDRERGLRFYHNSFTCLPEIAAEVSPLPESGLLFGFVMETDLVLDDHYSTSVISLGNRATVIGSSVDEFMIYLDEIEPDESDARVRVIKEWVRGKRNDSSGMAVCGIQ